MRLRVFYGGTFDPVHNGHLAIARAARDLLRAEVRLMPAADPPHRARPGADALQRIAMLELAIEHDLGLLVDRRELHRPGRSYTIDTLRDIRAGLDMHHPVALLLGADSFLDLPQWREWEELFELAHFIVAERPGNALDAGMPQALSDVMAGRWTADPADLQAAAGGRVLRLRQPLRPESATELRHRIASGAPWQDWVPPAVAEFITRHRLYHDRAPTPASL